MQHQTELEQDQSAREQAIDPYQSFIIQAPAGSGKTELLAQRYLNLLGHAVNDPEEIIAITFTRKAASEMRERIINALIFAASHDEPEEAHKKTTWRLARQVLAINEQKNWSLLANPNRLRILTIDALSAMLSAQMPLLSGFGAHAKITDDPQILYQQAVYHYIEQPASLQPQLASLLLHFDNNATVLSKLLINLLSKREQWLPHIIHVLHHQEQIKQALEDSLKNIVTEKLQQAEANLPADLKHTMFELLQFSAEQLSQTQPSHLICAAHNTQNFPDASIEQFDQWRALAELFITKQHSLRKTVDKRLGFPADKKPQKKQLIETLQQLSSNDAAVQALVDIVQCPPCVYTEKQWEIIEALVQVLPVLTAQLHVLFRQHGVTDFTEITLGALRSLGSEDEPTELALHLDYQIKHLLVDEFQDTSVMQFELFESLVREWQPGDGKTLFLVGDPMQSIYRFRQAEVGLFLRAQQQGLQQINLIPLALKRNFRSQPSIVNWINQSFDTIFPKQANITSGAVPYSASIAANQDDSNSGASYYSSDDDHTPQIIDLIQKQQSIDATQSIAILVKSRSQLKSIIPALIENHILFNAIELETLNHRPEIIDLTTLTKALLHLGDRIAWLGLLRAPWCGLTLKDLHIICQAACDKPLWSTLKIAAKLKDLSDDGKKRLLRITPTLAHTINDQGKLSLSEWIKGCWIGLNGPACLATDTAYNNCLSYFELLESVQHDFSLHTFEQKLTKLYAKPENQPNIHLHIMTIHKSKGLEFDHVIIPALQQKSPSESNHLLMWLEHPNKQGENDLVLAPVKASYENEDAIHRYLKLLETQKLTLESARLFYVATTRAKKTLHLLSNLQIDEKTGEFKTPNKSSFLSLLWQQYQSDFVQALEISETKTEQTQEEKTQTIQRLPNDIESTLNAENLPKLRTFNLANTEIEQITFTTHHANLVGVLIHEALQYLSQNNNQTLPTNYWQRRFIQLGLTESLATTLSDKIQLAIQNTLNSPRGQWILQDHLQAKSEYPITTKFNGQVKRHIIDRTFIADETRWIIDYKTSSPSQEPIEEFLQQQKDMYSKQLQRYATALQALEPHPVRCALYFPLCDQWIEWSPTPNKTPYTNPCLEKTSNK